MTHPGVLHIVNSLAAETGGPAAVVRGLATGQIRGGRAVEILTTTTDPGTGVTIIPPPNRWGAVFGMFGTETIRGAVSRAGVVHLHGVWDGILLAAAAEARRQDRPYVVTPHGMLHPWSLAQKALKKQVALALGVRRMLNSAAAVQALNADEAAAVRRLRLRPPVHTIPNGLDVLPAVTGDPHAIPPAVEALTRDGRPIVLFLGRLHHKKGLDILAAAFAGLAVRHPATALVVAGPDHGGRADFAAAVRALGVADRTHLIGPVYGPTKAAVLAAAACFVLPSRQEGFSIAILEALAAGVPVVISETCYFPEVAAGAGVVVPLDAAAVAAGLDRVLSDPAAGRAMGQAGRRLVAERYTWETIVTRCDAMYAAASGRSGTGS